MVVWYMVENVIDVFIEIIIIVDFIPFLIFYILYSLSQPLYNTLAGILSRSRVI